MSNNLKPCIFLGQQFETMEDFRRAFPAYAQYAEVVAKGADTPHKVECVLYRRGNRQRVGGKIAAKKLTSPAVRKATRARLGTKKGKVA